MYCKNTAKNKFFDYEGVLKQTDYENHPVHHNLQEILNKLDEDDSSDIDVRELKAILDYMSWMLSQSDVALLKKRRFGRF